ITNAIIYISFITIIQTLVFFALSFDNHIKVFKKYKFLNYLYIITLFLILIPQIGVLRLDVDNPVNYNSIAYYILSLYCISYLIIYIKLFIDKYSTVQNKNIKNNIQLFLLLPSLAIMMTLITNIVVPSLLNDISLILYGPIFMLIIAVTVLMGIFKYKLFDINASLANLLIALIVTLSLLLLRFSIIDKSISNQFQTNILFTFTFSWIYIFLTREVYMGLKKQIVLNQQKKTLEIALDSRNVFLQNSSHQFRTPLTVILGYLGMIINKENPKYEANKLAIENLKKTYISAKNLNEIINDVLAANDVNTGKFGINIRDNVDLQKIIQSIMSEKKELLFSKKTKVNLRIKGESGLINIDAVKIKEAINNIFDNAIFYGGGKIDIFINYSLENVFEISFQDNGVGITGEDAKKIWKKFERGKKSPQINPNGSGLGLYLAKQIVVQHGGDIIVKSDGLNKGSKFTLTNPKNINIDTNSIKS
ncbi:MAG: ATP-binding protein, partial [Candidatus Paceibacterota bacterium]